VEGFDKGHPLGGTDEEIEMDVSRSLSGVENARLLAELALAIDQAQKAAASVGLTHGGGEAHDLRVRLEVLKAEVDELRRGGWRVPARELGSKWIKLGSG
jgi:hypothetical protein